MKTTKAVEVHHNANQANALVNKEQVHSHVHEVSNQGLEIYQMELYAQNTELLRTQAELEAVLAQRE